jgi:hypothetical protein
MSTDLSEFIDWREWLTRTGNPVFPTRASLEWFLREHRQELIDSGEFLPGAGNRSHLLGPKFGALVVDVLRRKASERRPTAIELRRRFLVEKAGDQERARLIRATRRDIARLEAMPHSPFRAEQLNDLRAVAELLDRIQARSVPDIADVDSCVSQ